MASLPFQRMPITVNLPSAPRLLAQDIVPLLKLPPPVDAYWQFGDDKPDLLDELNGVPLVRNINFAKPGTMNGYTQAPNIVIAGGGGGVGATARAVIDGSGNLQKIYLDQPGTGYTVAPAATVVPIGAGTAGALTVNLGAAPVLHPGYMTIPTSANNARNGLLTPFADAGTQTMIAIIKPQGGTGVAQIPFGALTEDAVYGPGGDSVYYYVSGWRQQTAPGVYSAVVPSGIVLGNWIGIAIAQDNVNNIRRVSFYAGGQVQHFYTQAVHKDAAPHRNVALGNAWYNGSGFYTSLDVAMFMTKGGFLVEGEMLDIFQTEASKAAQRGVIIP